MFTDRRREAPVAMAAPPLETLERLAEAHSGARQAPAKRMLVIVNPYATTVSDRLRHLVVYALRGRYDVEAVDTTGRNHATEICREAAHEGYDVVVSFGGDGTLNEAANGLAGSDTPLTALPGGATNVYSRVLGIPHDIVDATSTCSASPTTSTRARSTSPRSTTASSPSRAASGSTQRSSSASTSTLG